MRDLYINVGVYNVSGPNKGYQEGQASLLFTYADGIVLRSAISWSPLWNDNLTLAPKVFRSSLSICDIMWLWLLVNNSCREKKKKYNFERWH